MSSYATALSSAPAPNAITWPVSRTACSIGLASHAPTKREADEKPPQRSAAHMLRPPPKNASLRSLPLESIDGRPNGGIGVERGNVSVHPRHDISDLADVAGEDELNTFALEIAC